MKDSFEIILVEPQNSLNIGSVARAMANLDFNRLHLVNPVDFKEQKAAITGCHAEEVLDKIQLHDSLQEALAHFDNVVGFSTRGGKNRTALISLDKFSINICNEQAGKTALVFGPEDTGLRNEHLELCRHIVTIPSSIKTPSYNLSQAVLIVLWEISKMDFDPTELPEEPARWEEHEQLEKLIDELALEAGFYGKGTPEHIPPLLRNIFKRPKLTKREISVLLGFFAKAGRELRRLKKQD